MMFPSSGYFRGVNCPYFASGLCDRACCHFRHSKPQEEKPKENLASYPTKAGPSYSFNSSQISGYSASPFLQKNVAGYKSNYSTSEDHNQSNSKDSCHASKESYSFTEDSNSICPFPSFSESSSSLPESAPEPLIDRQSLPKISGLAKRKSVTPPSYNPTPKNNNVENELYADDIPSYHPTPKNVCGVINGASVLRKKSVIQYDPVKNYVINPKQNCSASEDEPESNQGDNVSCEAEFSADEEECSELVNDDDHRKKDSENEGRSESTNFSVPSYADLLTPSSYFTNKLSSLSASSKTGADSSRSQSFNGSDLSSVSRQNGCSDKQSSHHSATSDKNSNSKSHHHVSSSSRNKDRASTNKDTTSFFKEHKVSKFHSSSSTSSVSKSSSSPKSISSSKSKSSSNLHDNEHGSKHHSKHLSSESKGKSGLHTKEHDTLSSSKKEKSYSNSTSSHSSHKSSSSSSSNSKRSSSKHKSSEDKKISVHDTESDHKRHESKTNHDPSQSLSSHSSQKLNRSTSVSEQSRKSHSSDKTVCRSLSSDVDRGHTYLMKVKEERTSLDMKNVQSKSHDSYSDKDKHTSHDNDKKDIANYSDNKCKLRDNDNKVKRHDSDNKHKVQSSDNKHKGHSSSNKHKDHSSHNKHKDHNSDNKYKDHNSDNKHKGHSSSNKHKDHSGNNKHKDHNSNNKYKDHSSDNKHKDHTSDNNRAKLNDEERRKSLDFSKSSKKEAAKTEVKLKKRSSSTSQQHFCDLSDSDVQIIEPPPQPLPEIIELSDSDENDFVLSEENFTFSDKDTFDECSRTFQETNKKMKLQQSSSTPDTLKKREVEWPFKAITSTKSRLSPAEVMHNRIVEMKKRALLSAEKREGKEPKNIRTDSNTSNAMIASNKHHSLPVTGGNNSSSSDNDRQKQEAYLSSTYIKTKNNVESQSSFHSKKRSHGTVKVAEKIPGKSGFNDDDMVSYSSSSRLEKRKAHVPTSVIKPSPQPLQETAELTDSDEGSYSDFGMMGDDTVNFEDSDTFDECLRIFQETERKIKLQQRSSTLDALKERGPSNEGDYNNSQEVVGKKRMAHPSAQQIVRPFKAITSTKPQLSPAEVMHNRMVEVQKLLTAAKREGREADLPKNLRTYSNTINATIASDKHHSLPVAGSNCSRSDNNRHSSTAASLSSQQKREASPPSRPTKTKPNNVKSPSSFYSKKGSHGTVGVAEKTPGKTGGFNGENMVSYTFGSRSEKRKAHVPTSSNLKRPLIAAGDSSKVPINVRQRYLNLMIDEFLKFRQEDIAFQKGLEEEQEVYKRAINKNIYLRVAVIAIKRIRTEAAESQPSSSKKAKLDSSSTSVSQSHAAVLGGSRAAKTSYTLNRSGPNRIQIEFKGVELYKRLKKYIMTEEQLRENNYPRPSEDGSNKAKYYTSQVQDTLMKDNERLCRRCGHRYYIQEDGSPVIKQECIYHYANLYKKKVAGSIDSRYGCCNERAGVKGCQIANTHVNESNKYEKLSGYMKTLPASESDPKNTRVLSLDCEMVYTKAGMELARVTVIGDECQVLYESLVNPDTDIIDYNTRFSGITAKNMKGVETTLREVQAVMLSMVSDKTILIGHSLESDLTALKMIHNTVVDTSIVFPHRLGLPCKRALRNLMVDHLQKIIQADDGGHDSKEDAVSCMELMVYKVKQDAKGEIRRF